MVRSYTKGKRAEQEAETRRRIAAAALALHGEVGPNRTTISMIAERAGVQRHTVYAHYADDRAILMACSGLHLERDPPPSPDAWAGLNDPATRLATALGLLYCWYARNARLLAVVMADAESNATLREINELRTAPAFGAMHASLSTGLGPDGQAALALAFSFHTWRTLVQDAGQPQDQAVELMVRSVLRADE